MNPTFPSPRSVAAPCVFLSLALSVACGSDSTGKSTSGLTGTGGPSTTGLLGAPGDNPGTPGVTTGTVSLVGAVDGQALESREYRGSPCDSGYPVDVRCYRDGSPSTLHLAVKRPGGSSIVTLSLASNPSVPLGAAGGAGGQDLETDVVWTSEASAKLYSTVLPGRACTTRLSAFDASHAVGLTTCFGLEPTLGGAAADLTVSFDCPVADASGPPICVKPATGTAGTSGIAGNLGVAGTPSNAGKPGVAGSPSTASCHGFSFCLGSTISDCSATPGCTYGGKCLGISDSCYSQYGSYSCGELSGCYWDSYSKSCSGSSDSCSYFHSDLGCIYQSGCHWDESCVGTALDCTYNFDEFGCTAQPGCYWY